MHHVAREAGPGDGGGGGGGGADARGESQEVGHGAVGEEVALAKEDAVVLRVGDAVD